MPSNSLEQEAMERVRRMYASFDRPPERGERPPERPPEPAPLKGEKPSPPEKTEKPHHPPEKPKNGLLDLLMKDKDQSLIMLLLVILMKDGADMNLLLALVYLLI